MDKYTKTSKEVIEECEKALKSILNCQAPGAKCAPNESDFDLVREALYSISEYKELRK